MMITRIVLFAVALLKITCQAFYIENVRPRSFQEGEEVKLKVNKLTSTKTLFPVDYYRLPFCQPVNGPKLGPQNLGEFLAGDRIETSPYRIRMKEESFCEQLCITNLGRSEVPGIRPNKVVKAIHRNYHHNWIVDNLPAASKIEDEDTITTSYGQGFPVGFTTHKTYIYNHVNIEIMYHQVDPVTDNKYRIVRFTVEPFSIKHDFVPNEDNDPSRPAKKIINPIESCDPQKTKRHTDWDMVVAEGHEPQEASGKVLFTYDVIWESTELHWASRWDVYLNMDYAIPFSVHWTVLTQYIVLAMTMSGIVATILVRNLRRYDRLSNDDEGIETDLQTRWKSIHADVFRPPTFSPMLLSVCCGTGFQLLGATVVTVLLAAAGLATSANRGSFIMCGLFSYAVMGIVAGYVMARMYKTFDGDEWQRATCFLAFGFPGICFATLVAMDFVAECNGSVLARPLSPVCTLALLWLGISSPLVFLGAYIGYRQNTIAFPVDTRQNPRPIPEQPCWTSVHWTMAAAIVPFGPGPPELNVIMATLWKGTYYYDFALLLTILIILTILCAANAIVLTYIQLCYEDYRWHWRTFLNAGSIAIYVFLYACYYLDVYLEANFHWATWLFYFGYMVLICGGLFITIGSIGLVASLWFSRKLYASLTKTGTVEMLSSDDDESAYLPPDFKQLQTPKIQVV